MKQRQEKSVLFLCTGNFYRSRFAEILFNSVAERMRLPWKASSRGLALERGVNNVGPVKAPGEWETLRKAQATAASRREFTGNVLFVETHDFVRKPEESPCPTHGHHEFANAETYFLVGDALGKGMIKLLTNPKKEAANEPAKPTAHKVRNIEGWNVRVDESNQPHGSVSHEMATGKSKGRRQHVSDFLAPSGEKASATTASVCSW
jgi:hypothetical protein